MKLLRTGPRSFALALAVAALAGSMVWAAVHALAAADASTLSSWAPQGSLLTIEAQDFSGLLQDWNKSPEERAWVKSDNYSAFSRSRLFGRLGEAQEQFAAAAGLAPNAAFLQQVAGKESLFAWYDIGKLEFLYITHLPQGSAEQTPLLQLRSKFQQRQAGKDTFYIRTQGEPERTVAFATHGEYLLLATRADLMAKALMLMQQPGSESLRNEAWYSGMVAGAGREPGDLRMALNLARIVPTPYFRSYWVQRNVSEMKRYGAAVTDLYRETGQFREERMLVPVSLEGALPTADLSSALAHLPADAGVYRVTAHPGPDEVVGAIGEKLFPREASSYRDSRAAPRVVTSESEAGSAEDLETRIDAVSLSRSSQGESVTALRELIAAMPVESMLVASSTSDAPDGVFLPMHSVLVLSATVPWSAEAMKGALTSAMRARLTTGAYGLNWQDKKQAGARWVELSGLQPMAFAAVGNVCLLATDAETLLQALQGGGAGKPTGQTASVVAGFSHAKERAHFERLTKLLDHNAGGATSNEPPPFFSRNLVSLSQTFQSLDSETFTEQPDQKTHVVRQTVVYRWAR